MDADALVIRPLLDDSLWFGPLSMYTGIGVEEAARRKATRPVVRIVPV